MTLDIAHENNECRMTDVTDRQAVTNVFLDVRPDVVVHLAALTGSTVNGGGSDSVTHPFNYFMVNATGTLNVFDACRELRIDRVVLISSFSAYGQARCPIDEETPFQPANPYGASKACAEQIVNCYSALYGIKTVIFRVPFICGESQKTANVLREFVGSALADIPLTLLGDGTHVREFIHPSDVATAISAGISHSYTMDKPYDTFVLGSTPVSMKDLAQLVIRTVGKGSIVFKPSVNHVFDQFSNYDKATRVLGWMPTMAIGEIVRRVVQDMKSSM
jgi:nucleoside-diphosphate-sugar epimerase